MYNVFFNKPKKKYILSHEPLFYSFLFLIFGSLFLGYIFKPYFFNPTLSFSIFPFYSFQFDLEFINIIIRFIPIIIFIIGINIGIFIDKIIYFNLKIYIYYFMPFYTLFNRRYFFDILYNKIITIIEKNNIYKYIDNGVIDIYIYTKRYITLY
jgi:NADH:ubiquinone oxidoreductase subunit 5 (subunit L)/multisubunit Na+/H+ antiporter MnhA subunit